VKRLVDLTVEDLAANPVWRYVGGSGAQATIAPASKRSLSEADDEVFLAATEFELADSSRHRGFCFPADDSGIDYLQPVILTPTGHVNFWFDEPVAPEALSAQWGALGKDPRDIFPVAFRCLVPVDGRTDSGRVASVASPQDLPAPALGTPGPHRTDTAERSRHVDRVPAARPVGARGRRGAIEKRTARRRKAEMKVEFTQDALHGTGVTGDISRRGMFVRTTRAPGTGPRLRLTVSLPDGRQLVLTGRVVRRAGDVSPSGFGLRLADDWPNYENFLPRRRDTPE
jgi:hypothetical protein